MSKTCGPQIACKLSNTEIRQFSFYSKIAGIIFVQSFMAHIILF